MPASSFKKNIQKPRHCSSLALEEVPILILEPACNWLKTTARNWERKFAGYWKESCAQFVVLYQRPWTSRTFLSKLCPALNWKRLAQHGTNPGCEGQPKK